MEIFEELEKIYNELRAAGVVRTKKELAQLLGVAQTGLIMAMKGDPRYATPSLLTKMTRFRNEHLGAKEPAPKKDITIPAETIELYTSMAKACETLSALVAQYAPHPWPGMSEGKNLATKKD